MGKVFVVSFLLLSLIMVACGEETKTFEENTLTISVVDVEESITCDTVEGPCVLVTFDGENCMLEEPKDNETGCYVVAFTNLSDGVAKIEAMTLTDGKTLEDLAEDASNRPTEYLPYWVSLAGIWDKSVAAGDSVKIRGCLKPGINGIMCFRVPYYAIYGDGFTVEDTTSHPVSTPRPTPSSQIEVTWDGNECIITGSSVVPVGYHEFIRRDRTDRCFLFAVRQLNDPYTFQDFLDVQDEPGMWFTKPNWLEMTRVHDKREHSVNARVYTYHFGQAGSYPIVIWDQDLLLFCGAVIAEEESME